jgi:hypothetical protein
MIENFRQEEVIEIPNTAIVTKTKPYTGEPRLLSQEDIIASEQVPSL